MNILKKVFFILLCLNILMPCAEIIPAKSCAQSDVQEAVNRAKDGDIVTVPEGNSVWISPEGGGGAGYPSVEIKGKSIVLQGSGTDKTVIYDSTGIKGWQVPLLFREIENNYIRITGFTFKPVTTDIKGIIAMGASGGQCRGYRIDHCNFDGFSNGVAIITYRDNYGVIDHCNFITSEQKGNFKAFSVCGRKDESWKTPLSLGSKNAVYIENCTFDYKFHYRNLDGSNGARFVMRYNTIYNSEIGTHGYDSSERSNISMEIYNNTFFHTIENSWVAVVFRGGTGVVFNNRIENITGSYAHFISLYYYCACPGNLTCHHETCTEYPCFDQPGYAPDSDNDGIQDSEPVYEWGNSGDLPEKHIKVADICDEVHGFIQEGRDYYINTEKPGYTPYIYPHPYTVPGHVFPENNSSNNPLTIKLIWQSLFGAQKYHIQVARDTSFLEPVIDTTGVTDTFLTVDSVDSSTHYFWRVCEDRGDSSFVWGLPWSFYTVGSSPIKNYCNGRQTINSFLTVHKFNDKVDFMIKNKKTEKITITLYNSAGRLVWNFTTSEPAGGIRRITWDRKNQAGGRAGAGMYIVRTITGNLSRTDNFFLL